MAVSKIEIGHSADRIPRRCSFVGVRSPSSIFVSKVTLRPALGPSRSRGQPRSFRAALIEARYADGRQERLPELAAELLRLKVDIIASATTQAVQAVRRADPAIPIVMTNMSDPIGSGLADSLSHPGGHTTGVTMLSTDAAAKRLALLKEAFPALKRVAVLAYRRHHPPTALLFNESVAAAEALELEVQLL